MDTSTEQEFAVLDMWASRLTQYCSAMGMVLVLYDGLLTLTDEVHLILRASELSPSKFTLLWQMRLVWPGPLNFPKVLYYVNRYLTTTSMLFCTYR